ncbi:MAG: hypothetical protein ACT4QF_16275 [Sporichthyaceae bacterium]
MGRNHTGRTFATAVAAALAGSGLVWAGASVRPPTASLEPEAAGRQTVAARTASPLAESRAVPLDSSQPRIEPKSAPPTPVAPAPRPTRSAAPASPRSTPKNSKPTPKPSAPSTPTPSPSPTSSTASTGVFDVRLRANFDADTVDAFRAATARWNRLFDGSLAPASFRGTSAYRRVYVEVVHEPNLSSAMSTTVTSTRADGTALSALVAVRDLNNPLPKHPRVREALAAHELAHVVVNGVDRNRYCTAEGWTGPLARAAYLDVVDDAVEVVPTLGSDGATASCSHWSPTWAYSYHQPDSIGPGPAPEILNPTVGSYSVIGPVTIALALDNRPSLPLDPDVFEAYPSS